ncbi:MAG: response regulator transcription factor [Chloroflexi bacterium]|nr:response regulator transcription factor [Chloroflexota bacterium]
MTIRVLLVDDHPVVLDGLASAFAGVGDVVVVGRATTAAEAGAILAGDPIDVALVDIRLPDQSGLELMAEQARASEKPAWVVLSSFETPQHLAAALSLGAAGYLLKTASFADILAAVRFAAAGGLAFTPAQLHAAHGSGTRSLGGLDREIVRGLVAGRTNDQIAHDLGVARATVEAHLTRLFQRFGVASRTELAVRAARDGWLDLPGGR